MNPAYMEVCGQSSLTERVVDLEVVLRLGGKGHPCQVLIVADSDAEVLPRAAARRDQEHEEA